MVECRALQAEEVEGTRPAPHPRRDRLGGSGANLQK